MGASSFDFLFLNPRVVPKLGATRGRPPSEVGVHLRLHLPDTGVVWNVTECDRATGRARGYVQGAPQPWRSFHLAVLLLWYVLTFPDAGDEYHVSQDEQGKDKAKILSGVQGERGATVSGTLDNGEADRG